MKKYLIRVVDDAEKYLMQLEHDFKWGHMGYEAAVGAVVGIVSYAKSVVCDLAYESYSAPSLVTSLLDRLDEMQLEVNGKLFTMEYE